MSEREIVVSGGITAGRRVVGGERGESVGETLKSGSPIPEGARVSEDLVSGSIRDMDSVWILLTKDNGKPHKTSQERYVYVLESSRSGKVHAGEKFLDGGTIPAGALVLSKFFISGIRDSEGNLWYRVGKNEVTTEGRFVYMK